MVSCRNCKKSCGCNEIKAGWHDCKKWERKDNLSITDYLNESVTKEFMEEFEESMLQRNSLTDVFEDICEQGLQDGDWNRGGL